MSGYLQGAAIEMENLPPEYRSRITVEREGFKIFIENVKTHKMGTHLVTYDESYLCNVNPFIPAIRRMAQEAK